MGTHGAPCGLPADYTATTTAALTVQGLLAGLLAQARGSGPTRVSTRADHAGLLTVSQYLAAAGADEGDAADIATGGPTFTSAEGLHFELETLDPAAWAAFWRALDTPADAVRHGHRGAVGHERIGPALHPSCPAVRAFHVDDRDTHGGQDPGEFGSVDAGALHQPH
ncbi:hypothetical protein [Streptomyces sp. NPDC007883]|uniref:hypothetical protein n=1 Tax=Streptomyces sp. NPDC007883 TaxID=3155116 RepID=UPI0033E89986